MEFEWCCMPAGELAKLFARLQHPGARMLREADMRVIIHGRGCGKQYQARRRAGFLAGSPDQFLADAAALMRLPHRQIRQVGDVAEIGKRARDANEQVAVPRRHDDIRVADHRRHALRLAHRAALAKRRSAVQVNYLGDVQIVARAIRDHVDGLWRRHQRRSAAITRGIPARSFVMLTLVQPLSVLRMAWTPAPSPYPSSMASEPPLRSRDAEFRINRPYISIPAGPPKSAGCGSWSRTSRGSSAACCNPTYGGLLTIRSKGCAGSPASEATGAANCKRSPCTK